MTKRPLSRYGEKRQLRLVPMEFSAPCLELCSALKDSAASEEKLRHHRAVFSRYLYREYGWEPQTRHTDLLNSSWQDLPALNRE